MTSVLLATFQLLPGGEPGGAALVDELAARSVDAAWASWDDPGVDWAGADLVAVRATWDYHRRLPEFLAWAREVGQRTRLLNGAEVFAWNADKSYLNELAADVPTVPSIPLDDASLLPGLSEAFEKWGTVVVKPRTGAGGLGVVVVESLEDSRLEGLPSAPWMAQPLVESVRTKGETSVFVFGGAAVTQVDKTVTGDEIRVHELYGGKSVPVPLDPDLAVVAEDAVRAAAGRTGADLAYARADLMEYDGRWVLSELELIEPGLYLEVVPDNAMRFAEVLARYA